MKQISEVEEKPFTSSSSICPEACFRKRWGGQRNTFGPVDISLKDDVTVTLHYGVSFMLYYLYRGENAEPNLSKGP
jgi:hypothetical protein